jgi:hypothetical protein
MCHLCSSSLPNLPEREFLGTISVPEPALCNKVGVRQKALSSDAARV